MFQGHQFGNGRRALAQQSSGGAHDLAAFVGGGVFPDLKAFGGGGQRVIQIRNRRVRHAADQLARGGVVHRNDGVAARGAPFVVDHELDVGVGGGGCHGV